MPTPAHHLLARRFNKPPMPLKVLVNDLLMEILDLLYTEEEALVVSHIPLVNSSAKKVAKKLNRPVAEVRPILDDMVARGLIFCFGDGEARKYLVLPIFPGVFEAQMWISPDSDRTRRLAKLYDDYYTTEFSENMLKRPSRVFRIIPIEQSITENKTGVLPSDSIREVIGRHDAWSLANYCACRRQRDMLGDGCDKPMDVCMQFGDAARYIEKHGFGRLVSREEIMEAVDRSEEAGLIHFTDNVENANISCNCCACCCVSLATLTRFNTPAMFTSSRYRVAAEPARCVACEACIKICPAGALRLYDQKLMAEPWRCIGCGNCVSRCQSGALKLVLRPDHAPVPENFGQLFMSLGKEYMGKAASIVPHSPAYDRTVGNLIQKQLKFLFKK